MALRCGCLFMTLCNNISIKQQSCDPDIEMMTLNLRPVYFPREFSNIFITLVYIPCDANKAQAVDQLYEVVNNLANEKPNSLQIVLGDMNRSDLKSLNFTQYVTCYTRHEDSILDEFYCNVKNAYKSIQGAPLKNSDHNMIYMRPT